MPVRCNNLSHLQTVRSRCRNATWDLHDSDFVTSAITSGLFIFQEAASDIFIFLHKVGYANVGL